MKISNRAMILQELEYRLKRLQTVNSDLDKIQTRHERLEIEKYFLFHAEQMKKVIS